MNLNDWNIFDVSVLKRDETTWKHIVKFNKLGRVVEIEIITNRDTLYPQDILALVTQLRTMLAKEEADTAHYKATLAEYNRHMQDILNARISL